MTPPGRPARPPTPVQPFQQPLFDLLPADYLPPGMDRVVFVDLETTGGSPVLDRVTEVGVVVLDASGVAEWSSLVNPGVPIPACIQKLTGITDAMVANAPAFAELASALAERLAGALFVAHNARFDQGFLRAEFERAGVAFDPAVACSVRLSRRLYPEQARHNLDAVVQAHGLTLRPEERHRALGDARAVWAFWRHACRSLGCHPVHQAVQAQGRPQGVRASRGAASGAPWQPAGARQGPSGQA